MIQFSEKPKIQLKKKANTSFTNENLKIQTNESIPFHMKGYHNIGYALN